MQRFDKLEKDKTFNWLMQTLILPLLDEWGTHENIIDAVNQWTDLGQVVTNNLEEQSGFSPERIKKIAQLWPKRHDHFTPENIIEAMQRYKPDLLERIKQHPDGIDWLCESAVPSLKKELL